MVMMMDIYNMNTQWCETGNQDLNGTLDKLESKLYEFISMLNNFQKKNYEFMTNDEKTEYMCNMEYCKYKINQYQSLIENMEVDSDF